MFLVLSLTEWDFFPFCLAKKIIIISQFFHLFIFVIFDLVLKCLEIYLQLKYVDDKEND